MRRWLFCLALLSALLPRLVSAQSYGWCGYGLIQGIPLMDNQLAVLEAITPPDSASINPAVLFQHRFNLTHTAVIIEGCWNVVPTREGVISLLALVVPFDATGMADEIARMDYSQPVTETDVVTLYIDDHLSYTIFQGTRDESAAETRAYLSAHILDWETPEP